MMLLPLVHNQPCTISSKMRLFGQCPGNDCRCKHDNNEDVSNLVDVVTNNIEKEWLFPSCHTHPFIRCGYFAYLHIVSSCYQFFKQIMSPILENTAPKNSKLKKGYNKLFENVTSINVIVLAAFFQQKDILGCSLHQIRRQDFEMCLI